MEKNTESEEIDLFMDRKGGEAPFIKRDLSGISGPFSSTSPLSRGELNTPQEPQNLETTEHPLEPIAVEGLKNRELKRKLNDVIYFLRNQPDMLKIVIELSERITRLEGAVYELSPQKKPATGQSRPVTAPSGVSYETKKLPWRPHGDGEKYWLSPANNLTPVSEVPAEALEKSKLGK